jgi:hypothetical protein
VRVLKEIGVLWGNHSTLMILVESRSVTVPVVAKYTRQTQTQSDRVTLFKSLCLNRHQDALVAQSIMVRSMKVLWLSQCTHLSHLASLGCPDIKKFQKISNLEFDGFKPVSKYISGIYRILIISDESRHL